FLANRGYAVLQVNYRGSTGYGRAFRELAVGEYAGRMHDDLIDAVRWAVAGGVADPARVAIYGGSYGGYAALVGMTFTPDVFACGVDVVGISNLISFYETVPPYWKSSVMPLFEGWQAAARALLREGVAPAEVGWREASPGEAPPDLTRIAPTPGAARVPRQFLDLARQAASAADPARWHVLYDVLWRLVRENRDLLNDTRDPQVRRLNSLAEET